MVGEAQRAAVLAQLAVASAGHAAGGSIDVEAAGEQMVDRRRGRSAPRGRSARASSSKTSGSRPGRRLRSPPKSSGSSRRPSRWRSPAASSISSVAQVAACRRWRGGWRRRGRRPVRTNAIVRRSGRRLADRQLAALGDRRRAGWRGAASVRLEPPSLEAIRSGLRRAIAARSEAESELREVRTRWGSAPQARGEGGGPARRALLQEGDVPLGAGEEARELGQRSRLTWTWVSFRSVVRSSRERQVSSERSGGAVAAVEEVPGQRA